MTVYERDFYGWTQQQAQLLREHDFAKLDLENLIKEIEGIGRSERRQLANRLELLLMHLPKWHFQPALRGRSWELTILEQRRRIAKLLRENPSLQPLLVEISTDVYEDAAFSAMRETGLALETFPAECPSLLRRCSMRIGCRMRNSASPAIPGNRQHGVAPSALALWLWLL